MNLSTKAKTLELLKNKLKHAEVLPLVRFSVKEFKENEAKILEKISKIFGGELIVRSLSNAGGFENVLYVEKKRFKKMQLFKL